MSTDERRDGGDGEPRESAASGDPAPTDSAAAHERPTPASHQPAFAVGGGAGVDSEASHEEPGLSVGFAGDEARQVGPSALLSGLWFGGTLAWASSVLLMLDHVGAVDRASGPILWMHALAFALYVCTQVGAERRDEEQSKGLPVRRGAVVLGTGLLAVAAFALFLGVLVPVNARGAYVLLGLYGIAVFFFAERRAWRASPGVPPETRRYRRIAEAAALLGTVVIWALER